MKTTTGFCVGCLPYHAEGSTGRHRVLQRAGSPAG